MATRKLSLSCNAMRVRRLHHPIAQRRAESSHSAPELLGNLDHGHISLEWEYNSIHHSTS